MPCPPLALLTSGCILFYLTTENEEQLRRNFSLNHLFKEVARMGAKQRPKVWFQSTSYRDRVKKFVGTELVTGAARYMEGKSKKELCQ
jgi:hypothetical protein